MPTDSLLFPLVYEPVVCPPCPVMVQSLSSRHPALSLRKFGIVDALKNYVIPPHEASSAPPFGALPPSLPPNLLHSYEKRISCYAATSST